MKTLGSLLLIYCVVVPIAYVITSEDPYSFVMAQVLLTALSFGSFLLGRISRPTPAN